MATLESRKLYFLIMRIIGLVWYVLFFGFLVPITVVFVSVTLDQFLARQVGLSLHLSWITLVSAGLFFGASLTLLAVSAFTLHRCGKGWPWSVGPHVAFNPQYLVETGPYMVVRHPMAVAYLLYLLGISCLVPSLVMFVWFVPLIGGLCYEFLEYTEEIRLRRWFGEQYAQYHERTPSLIPRWKQLKGWIG